jgi:hypothetical protein
VPDTEPVLRATWAALRTRSRRWLRVASSKVSKVRTVCVRSASTDPCGGCRATGIPTATGGLSALRRRRRCIERETRLEPGLRFTELRFNGYRLRRQAMVASRLVPLGPSLSMTSASREVLIGGGPALHKGPALPRWRVCTVFASRAEPESENSDLRSMTCRSAECPHSSD